MVKNNLKLNLKKKNKLPISIFFLICFLLGIYANLAQIAIFKFLIGTFYGTEIHIGIFLSLWLFGISVGGLFSGNIKIKFNTLCVLFVIIPFITTFAAIKSINLILPNLNGSLLSILPVVKYMGVIILPVSFCIGMLLPILIFETNKSLGIFYSIEAIGSFIGGILFSFILNGTANPIITLLTISILPISSLLLYNIKTKIKYIISIITILLPITLPYFNQEISNKYEQTIWKKFHKLLNLERTVETPYQKLQIGSYYQQKSLFSNGLFVYSWPSTENCEKTVHTFMTSLKKYRNILILGALPPDYLNEFLKYNTKITLVELDKKTAQLISYSPNIKKKVIFIFKDPRRFLKETNKKFDGIFISYVSPVTLVGNRLFTIEALKLMRNKLSKFGVISLRTSGCENYLGDIKAKIILGTYKALKNIFKDVFAIHGHNITFFASNSQNIIPKTIKEFMKRFSKRKIKAKTFFPQSFFNLLMPFRQKELFKWLTTPTNVKLNTDTFPAVFNQQLKLWNIYSNTNFNKFINYLEKINIYKISPYILVIISLILFSFYKLRSIATSNFSISFGVAISGAVGILSEIILILLYQNQYGAAFKMSAFFFGVYMLGLATGAAVKFKTAKLNNLILIKSIQFIFVFICYIFVTYENLHTAAIISFFIFITALLNGIEFPMADCLLKNSLKYSTVKSASILIFSDNLGALFTGFISGIILLPIIGMKNSFLLAGTLLIISMLLLFTQKKINQ